jgi:activator of HSP90 ATPase
MNKKANPDGGLVNRSRRRMILITAASLGGLAVGATANWAQYSDEITRNSPAIHLEPMINTSRSHVYNALMDASKFDKIVELSGVLKKLNLGNKPSEIDPGAGGSFALFGGYITGRHIELVQDKRIVQAWRTGSWPAGIFSIVKFEFVEQASGTRIIFDHTSFPAAEAESLRDGWKAHYFEPMARMFV